MNTVTRLVLVPEDEFFRLKNEKMNETEKILNSNLPKEMKVALSNEIDYQKIASNNSNGSNGGNTGVEIPSNLLEHTDEVGKMETEKEIKEEITIVDEPLKPLYKFKHEEKTTKSPKIDKINELRLVLRSLDFLVDENGSILNENGNPIKKSDINEVVDFFSKKQARKKPVGTKRVLAVIKENELPIANLIINQEIKAFLNKKDIHRTPTWEILSKSF